MIQSYSINYTLDALDDLDSIYTYIATELQAEQAAWNQVKRIKNKLRKLDTFPEGFAVVEPEPWHAEQVRKLPVDNYVVYFLSDSDNMQVTILRIFYQGRNLTDIINCRPAKECPGYSHSI